MGLRLINNKHGFSLIEAMVTLAIMGVVAVGSMSMMSYLNKERKRNSVMLSVQIIRQKLMYTLSDNGSWDNSKNHNNNSTFINCGNTCAHDSQADFIVYDQANALVHDPRTNGFKADGSSCALTDVSCLIKVDVKLKLTCPNADASCANPNMVARVLFSLNPAANIEGLSLNGANYNFELFKGGTTGGGGSGEEGYLAGRFVPTIEAITGEIFSRELKAKLYENGSKRFFSFPFDDTTPSSAACTYPGPYAQGDVRIIEVQAKSNRTVVVTAGAWTGKVLCTVPADSNRCTFKYVFKWVYNPGSHCYMRKEDAVFKLLSTGLEVDYFGLAIKNGDGSSNRQTYTSLWSGL